MHKCLRSPKDSVFTISCDARFVCPDKTEMGFHINLFDLAFSVRSSETAVGRLMDNMNLKSLLSDYQFWFPSETFTVPQWLKTVEKCLFSTIRENNFIIFFAMRHYTYSNLSDITKILILVINLCVQKLNRTVS